MRQNSFRNEVKYFVNQAEYLVLKQKLKKFLNSDKNSDENGDYNIRSLYFDDINETSLFEKQSGILNRKKYRLRIYNLDKRFLKLEKKSRVGKFIQKDSLKLNYEQYEKLINKDYDFLMKIDNKLAIEFYLDLKIKIYRPKIVVEYIREAYILNYNKIRITFDKHLKNSLTSIDLFSSSMPLINSLDENYFILEIKFDNFLPIYLKSLLRINVSPNLAISKYVISRKRIKFHNWEDH